MINGDGKRNLSIHMDVTKGQRARKKKLLGKEMACWPSL